MPETQVAKLPGKSTEVNFPRMSVKP
jgi:hypothetical protein